MISIADMLLNKLNKPAPVKVSKFHDIDGTPATCAELAKKYGRSRSYISKLFINADYDYLAAFEAMNNPVHKSRGTLYKDMNGDVMTVAEISEKYGFPEVRIRRLFKYANYDHIEAFQLLVYQMNIEKHGDFSDKYLFKDGTPARSGGSQSIARRYGYVYRDVIAAFESVNWCYKRAYKILDSQQ